MHAGKLKAFDSLSNFYSVASHAVFATLIGVPEKRTKAVKRRYDLFEVLPDGSVRWRCTVEGHEQAMGNPSGQRHPTGEVLTTKSGLQLALKPQKGPHDNRSPGQS